MFITPLLCFRGRRPRHCEREMRARAFSFSHNYYSIDPRVRSALSVSCPLVGCLIFDSRPVLSCFMIPPPVFRRDRLQLIHATCSISHHSPAAASHHVVESTVRRSRIVETDD